MSGLPILSDEHLPALFRAADGLSAAGQRRRRYFFVGFLCCDLGGAATSCLDLHTVTLSIIGLTLLVAGLVGAILLLQEKPETDWYGGRALAESVKTLSWRYMMCAEPYAHGLPVGEAERKLINEMSALLKVERNLVAGLSVGQDSQISPEMKRIRSLGPTDRLKVYCECRINNQQSWYSTKGRLADQRLRLYNRVLVVIQFLAVLDAVSLAVAPHQLVAAVGFFATLAASLVAWQQLNQYGSLAAAYNLAAIELAGLQAMTEQIRTERELEDYVLNAERAISREHTLWRARRTE